MNGSVLELDFINGFAPHAGDTFDLVAYGSLTGNFSTIDIEGLNPGFQYTLAPDGSGNLQLTALNDGVPTDQYIWHYLLLLESGPWPSAKCDAHPDW